MQSVSEELVASAQDGERTALEEIVRLVQHRIYGLALRMLYNPADAEDATQEILIKVITRLGSFRGESRFETWVWRVAANHLLTTRKSLAERLELSLERFDREVQSPQHQNWSETQTEAYQGLVVDELRLTCLHGLLICLDRGKRLAYILGECFEFDSRQGGQILDITPAAYRKRLSRARARLRNFMGHNCGLINPDNHCRCDRAIPASIKAGWFNPNRPLFATHPARARSNLEALRRLPEVNEMSRLAALFRSQPDYVSPTDFVEEIKAVINA
jgi:RNA polymerase sigma factor (sigma-70 family)